MYYDASAFSAIIEANSGVSAKESNLDNFKYACLHDKAVLFENASI